MTNSTLKIENISLTDIVPSDNNVREIDTEGLEILEKSINNFGLVEPILINLKDGANRIISGHQRYDILLNEHISGDLKDDTVHLISFGDIGWVFKDNELQLDDDSELQLSLMLNNHQGKYKKSQLKDTIKKLELKGIDTSLTGFKKVELEKLKVKPQIKPPKSPKKEKQEDKKFKQIVTCPECGNKFET